MNLPDALRAFAFGLVVSSGTSAAAEPPADDSTMRHESAPQATEMVPETPTSSPSEHSGHAMPQPDAAVVKPIDPGGNDMGAMQGGPAPADARDPDAYAEGYEYTGMPGMEQSDRIVFGKLLLDEFEFLSGNEGDGYAWSLQGNYGGDSNKLWLRAQGLKVPGGLDPTTGAELFWWRPLSAFWGTQLGLRQDFGRGAHTYLAAGIEGLAPYWFEVQATAYVAEDGRFSARFKVSYDMRLTNRLILTPSLEANAYSRAEEERGLGAGLGNLERGLRLRYELHRKFAPYVGYVWERSYAATADLRRAEGEPVDEHRFVAGVRMWW